MRRRRQGRGIDGVLIDAPAPSLLPPPSALADRKRRARARWCAAASWCAAMHSLLMQGAPYDRDRADPWEQYRCGPAGGGAAVSVGSTLSGCRRRSTVATRTTRLLGRLRSDALLALRDRARADEAAAGGARAAGGTAAAAAARSARGGGKATAEALQERYLKARIREAEEARRVEQRAKETARVAGRLGELPAAAVDAAIGAGWEGCSRRSRRRWATRRGRAA